MHYGLETRRNRLFDPIDTRDGLFVPRRVHWPPDSDGVDSSVPPKGVHETINVSPDIVAVTVGLSVSIKVSSTFALSGSVKVNGVAITAEVCAYSGSNEPGRVNPVFLMFGIIPIPSFVSTIVEGQKSSSVLLPFNK